MKTILAAIVMCLALAGCFPTTMEALKKEGRSERFEIAESYQVVYRRLAPILRECYESAWIAQRTSVRSELYTDTHRAELVVEHTGALPPTRSMILMYELEAAGDGRTRVIFYSGFPSSSPLPPMFKQWATGEKTDCP